MVVDLDAIAANTAVLRERVARPLMAVVKADGYGHGLVPAARAVLAGGADSLGVAVLDEALALRAAGITAPLLAWLHGPGTDYAAALDRRRRGLGERRLGAGRGGGRGPCHRTRPPACTSRPTPGSPAAGRRRPTGRRSCEAAARAQADGEIAVVGLWSHMAYADAPTHPTIGAQVRVFEEAVGVARRAGLTDARRHLANSAATVALPDTWYDLVRPGRRPLRARPARRGPGRPRAAPGDDGPRRRSP